MSFNEKKKGKKINMKKLSYTPPFADILLRPVRREVSLKKKRFVEDGFDLDLSYITPRVIATGFPSEGKEALYRNPKEEVIQFLETRHKGHYFLWNLCSRRDYNIEEFHSRVSKDFTFDDHQAPPFRKMEEFCKSVDVWLTRNEKNIAVVHCKAGKGRTGVMCSCYILYAGLQKTSVLAMDMYARMRTNDMKGVNIPSQRRYVNYFGEAWTKYKGKEPFPNQTLKLKKVTLSSVPKSGMHFWFRINQDAKPLYEFNKGFKKKHSFKKGRNIEIDITDDVILNGDCQFDFRDRTKQNLKNNKIFQFWLNSRFIRNNTFVANKWELDGTWKDKKHKIVTKDFTIMLTFESMNTQESKIYGTNEEEKEEKEEILVIEKKEEKQTEEEKKEEIVEEKKEIIEEKKEVKEGEN